MQMIEQQKKILNEQGSAILISLFCISLLIYMACAFLTMSVNNYKMAKFTADSTKALWIAEAGVAQSIYDLKEDYFTHNLAWKEKDFSEGVYKVAITPFKSLGIHEILITSLGTYKDRNYNQSNRLIISVPTDYLFFFDGNGSFLAHQQPLKLSGPIHSNGVFNISAVCNPGNVLINKSEETAGPLISSAEIIYWPEQEGQPMGWYNRSVRIGEGKVEYNRFNNYCSPSQFNFHFSVYSIPADYDYNHSGNGSTSPIFYEFPGGSSPNPKVFTTSNCPQGLLWDGTHGGFRINIPTTRKKAGGKHYSELEYKTEAEWKDELYKCYKAYIDQNWYIQGYKETDGLGNEYIVIDNSCGLSTDTIINDGLAHKYVISKTGGTSVPIPTVYPLGLETIGDVDAVNNEYTFYPATRRIKELRVGSEQILPSPTNYVAYYEEGCWDASWDLENIHSLVAFNNAPPAVPRNIKITFSKTGKEDISFYQDGGSTAYTEFYTTDDPLNPDDELITDRLSTYCISHDPNYPECASPPYSWYCSYGWRNGYYVKSVAVGGKLVDAMICNYYRDGPGSTCQGAPGKVIFAAPAAGAVKINKVPYVYRDSDGVTTTEAGWYALCKVDALSWHEYELDGNSINITGGEGNCISLDPYVKLVEIDLSAIPVDSFPEEDIIFSEVPVLVKGSPRKKVTIVCLDDVYVQSINEYTPEGDIAEDDDERCSPVGIITAGKLWFYHNSSEDRWSNYNNEVKDDDDYLNAEEEQCVIRLNKVACLVTSGTRNLGGRAFKNMRKITGSITLWESDYNENNPLDKSSSYIYAKGNEIYLYANSFRGDNPETSVREFPPPHIPLDIRVKSWKRLNYDRVKKFLGEVKPYIENKVSIPEEIYRDLLKELE